MTVWGLAYVVYTLTLAPSGESHCSSCVYCTTSDIDIAILSACPVLPSVRHI